MSAHVLLNLLNELGKSDKRRGLPSILLVFRHEFNKFNNTRAQMLDSIYHMTLKLIKNHIFGVKLSRFYHLLRNIITLMKISCLKLSESPSEYLLKHV